MCFVLHCLIAFNLLGVAIFFFKMLAVQCVSDFAVVLFASNNNGYLLYSTNSFAKLTPFTHADLHIIHGHGNGLKAFPPLLNKHSKAQLLLLQHFNPTLVFTSTNTQGPDTTILKTKVFMKLCEC